MLRSVCEKRGLSLVLLTPVLVCCLAVLPEGNASVAPALAGRLLRAGNTKDGHSNEREWAATGGCLLVVYELVPRTEEFRGSHVFIEGGYRRGLAEVPFEFPVQSQPGEVLTIELPPPPGEVPSNCAWGDVGYVGLDSPSTGGQVVTVTLRTAQTMVSLSVELEHSTSPVQFCRNPALYWSLQCPGQ
jgi:hypothetical protein